MELGTIIGRFAPSPTGRMHLGNVYSALLSWLSVKKQGGEWLLRIEDIDPQRSKQQWADLIMDDLEWLGLTWDKGPYYQSQRGERYEHYLNILKEKGLIYPSYKTRAERLAVGAPQETLPNPPPLQLAGFYKAQRLKEGRETVITPSVCGRGADTLRVEDKIITYDDGHYGTQVVNLKEDIGDFIIRRRDGAWAYQLAVVVDDAEMGVTEVVRGCDLLQSAAQQIYLGGLLGFPELHYAHIPLLCNEAGQRLSKRDKSLDMSVLREKYTANEIIGQLAYYAGITEGSTPVSAEELLPLFSWDRITKERQIIVEFHS